MRVVIAEDSTLLREGLIRLLALDGIETVAAVDTAPALIDAVGRLSPDLAIVDVRMPPTWSDEGVRAALELRERWPDVAVLILSQYVEERYAAELLSGSTRAIGYLLKDRVALVVSESAVAKHVNAIFTKLPLPETPTPHRRVLAVLEFLAAQEESR